MEKFNFYLDQKVTTWMRTEFNVEAESFDEAVEKAKDIHKSGDLADIDWNEIQEVKEVISVDENNGYSTEELYHENGKLIYHNGY
jgi:hypothetical protein